MTSTAKHVSRFLPTLTEVVQPHSLAAVAADPLPHKEKLDLVVQLASAELEKKLQALIPTLVQAQLESLLPRLNLEIQTALRTAVEQAMEELAPPSN